MFFRRSTFLVLVLALLVGSGSVHATVQYAPTTQSATEQSVGGPAVTIDPLEEYPKLLTIAEIDKIDQLQNSAVTPVLLSPVGPDDTTVLMTTVDGTYYFTNTQDGSQVRVDSTFADQYIPLFLFGANSGWMFTWRDSSTVIGLAVDALFFEIVLVALDSTTGELISDPLVLPDVPISISPDASKLAAFAIQNNEDDFRAASTTQLPLRWDSRTTQSHRMFAPAFQQRINATRAQMPARLQQQLNTDYQAFQMTTETAAVLLVDVFTGDVQELTTFSTDTNLAGVSWSPDSTKLSLAYTNVSDRPPDQLDPDGSLLTTLATRDALGRLTPEQNPFLQNNTLQVFDLVSGNNQTLRAADGDGAIFTGNQSWSTDGQTLMVQMNHPAQLAGRTHPIYLFPERSSFRFYDTALQEVSRLEAPGIAAPSTFFTYGQFVSPDEVIFSTVVGTNNAVYYYNRASGALANVTTQAGSHGLLFVPGQIQASYQSRQLVFPFSSFVQPPDLYRMGWDGSGFSRLTWFNEELAQMSQTRMDPVSFQLSNGQTREGMFIQPADATFPPSDIPMVVWQEGGPGVPMTNAWAANVENPYALLPNFGLPMLVVPLSGREGLPTNTFKALQDGRNFGQIDIDEGAEIVRQTITRGWTTSDKVGITGCSYGGYFALQSLVRHTDLYAAANDQCSLVDTVAEWTRGSSPLITSLMQDTPYSNPQEFQQDSPIYNIGKIRAPLLSFHGTEDFLPITLNENLYKQVIDQGTPARMVTFIDEGHGLAFPESQLYAAQEQIRWFRTYLLGEEGPTPEETDQPNEDIDEPEDEPLPDLEDIDIDIDPALTAERCFDETGFCISGRIREFWEQSGGLPVFGYPTGPQQTAVIEGKSVEMQWFERIRLELHPDNARPYDVLLGRIGAERLDQDGLNWADFAPATPNDDCQAFAETGHQVCGLFRTYYNTHGLNLDEQTSLTPEESLALFGLPLSDAMTMTLSNGREHTVQWFERGRFEYHPDNPEPFKVLLGLLGNEVQAFGQAE
ncbi:MAG: hypothetical protein GFH27_549293n227 [Chloroflexi bacterium AL-W]|nr:hypothetical protein [Chloroflexi bacterium AL-N1]NOK67658.1 hypothetical protein [Chloroflexi bacterium AL-N10]NOK75572.1 hypothetical protein [Chloroflexi bacterium AL-N5]NOK82360.1 hypothetical protein [Chloroflexi bacterium AL-W]NOK90205.1 hypothetical protein [Chloroflexi bacterium AL-N15]